AHASGWLALTGADLDAKLDDRPLAPGQAFQLRHGQTLQFNNPKRGVRAYLATPGGFAAEPVMDAVATVMREQLGGLHGNGRGLHNSDRLQGKAGDAEPRTLPADALWYPGNEVVLDLIPGEQIAAFTGASLFAAFNQSWTLDQRADRMGMRLTGPALRYQGQALISEGIPLGAVQVPPDGQPIILMNDRQTIGGYPRLGAVTPLSLARLAQCAPGQKVRLRVVSQESARREMLNVISTLQAQGALPGLAHP
ncbi:allophanate hydrolase, partial [Halopseudomonas pachastrellae]